MLLQSRPGLPTNAMAAGNRALRQLVLVEREYAPSGKQRQALTKAVKNRWSDAIESEQTDVATVVQCLVETYDSHIDAMAAVDGLSFKKWNWGERAEGAPRTDDDPLARVKSEIKKASLNVSDFSTSDLESIDTVAKQPQTGYQMAIQQIWGVISRERENARLRADRIARYQPSFLAGQATLGSPLLTQVWAAAYSVATAGDANKNASIGGLWPDAQILAAVTTWRQQGTVDEVDNFHVPGGQAPIEDKSLRGGGETRGRQADFISAWGGGDINIHVDANPQH